MRFLNWSFLLILLALMGGCAESETEREWLLRKAKERGEKGFSMTEHDMKKDAEKYPE